MDKTKGLLSVFGIFQDRDAYFELLNQKNLQTKTVLRQTLIILVLAAFYGLIMGSYNDSQSLICHLFQRSQELFSESLIN